MRRYRVRHLQSLYATTLRKGPERSSASRATALAAHLTLVSHKSLFLCRPRVGLYPRVLLDAPRKIFGFSCATAEGSAKAQARSANAIRKWMTKRPPRASASFLLQNRVASNLFNRGAPPSRRGLVIVAENPATDLGGL